MTQNNIDQIHTCINELQMMRQLIDLKVADDFCGRMLGIYVMMRIDDITKIWSHNIPKGTLHRQLADDVKDCYNDGLRAIRDKLGAHFQTPDGKVDLFGSVELFKSINYANTICLIEDVVKVESVLEGTDVVLKGFSDTDLLKAKSALESLFSDNTAYITNGALDILGINKGGLISISEPQVKGQYLRSIELMVDIAGSLLNGGYQDVKVQRMFKRLFVCTVFNYHDNLITRTDIKEKAVQYEKGFDQLFLSLITRNDNKALLENAFEKFEKIYKIEPYINKNRHVRDHACAHFDEGSTMVEIDKEIDALNTDELKSAFDNMLNMFNYICNNVFTLKMLTLSPRTPIYESQMVTINNNENFYGEVPETGMPEEMSCIDILRSIRRRDNNYDKACDALHKKLMSKDINVYQEMKECIVNRLKEPSVDENEISVILNTIHRANNGYPQRLQCTLIEMLNDESIFKLHNAHLLWLLSSTCREDENIDIKKWLDSIILQGKVIPTSLSLLALLHLNIVKNHSMFVGQNKAHNVDVSFSDYCDSLTKPTEKLAIMIVLAQHWFWDIEYSYYRTYEIDYSRFFQNEMTKALNSYFVYIKFKDKKVKEYCEECLNKKLYLLLLHNLISLENDRNQKPNIFAEMWRYNCFFRIGSVFYEAVAVGLLDEITSNKLRAKEILVQILKENPINEEVIRVVDDFFNRNPELKDN